MGKTKMAISLYLISKKYAKKKANKWMLDDFNNVKLYDKTMNSCLRISFLLKNEK